MRSAGLTDIGLVRKVNEDCFLCEYVFKNIPFFIVADGMGGRNAGEVASTMAIEHIKNFIEKHLSEPSEDIFSMQQLIKNSIEYANEKVYKKSILSTECIGMGTTLSMACIVGTRLIIGHVGDSRVYQIRNNSIKKLTEDHSLVEELVKNGTIKPEEANTHPQKNIITRALGTEYMLDVDLYDFEILDGDYIILCTDGLSNMVEEEDIVRIILMSHDSNSACEKLVEIAKNNGGYDNITVIVIKVEAGGE